MLKHSFYKDQPRKAKEVKIYGERMAWDYIKGLPHPPPKKKKK